jgi:SAM-dependent methyltransferase
MNFEAYSRYYDLLYSEKDTVREVDYVEELLSRNGCVKGNILELGCGSGRHGEVFKERGWNWVGIERSAEMAALACKKDLEVITGSAENTTVPGHTFDAVTSLFHVVSYLADNEQLMRVLQNAYNHLRPSGLFLFDVWYSPAVYHQRPEPRVREVEDESTLVVRRANPEIDWNRNLVSVHYDIEMSDKITGSKNSFHEVHPMRHFSLPELQLATAACGFEWVFAEQWLTGSDPSENTWGVCCCVRKKV